MAATINRRGARRASKRSRLAAARRLRKNTADSYWEAARRPMASLLLIAPLLAVYEIGCLLLDEASRGTLRGGADSWIRRGLVEAGWGGSWIPPFSVVAILIGWQLVQRRGWSVRPATLAAMVFESLILAVALVGVSRLVDLAGEYLGSASTAAVLALGGEGAPSRTASVVGFLGAGIYEEFLFRLVLIPVVFYGLRLVRTPQVLASALAVSGSGLLFSLAHHAGASGESFTWFAFVFRWFAGVAFGWIFVIRGFGIAVGAHTAYDVLVGWFGWHF